MMKHNRHNSSIEPASDFLPVMYRAVEASLVAIKPLIVYKQEDPVASAHHRRVEHNIRMIFFCLSPKAPLAGPLKAAAADTALLKNNEGCLGGGYLRIPHFQRGSSIKHGKAQMSFNNLSASGMSSSVRMART